MGTISDTQTALSRIEIETILNEEERFFVDCHQREPVGRETEDVVDNAFSRILRTQDMAYTVVAEIYSAMRCKRGTDKACCQ